MVSSALNISKYLHDEIRKPRGGQEIDWPFLITRDRSDTRVPYSRWWGVTFRLCVGVDMGPVEEQGINRARSTCQSSCLALHVALGLPLISSTSSPSALPSNNNTHTHIGCSPSTHSLVSGNLNDGVSYTRKTLMLKRLVHAQPKSCHQNLL